MYSLTAYKEQVYNLGSPQPNPTLSPCKSLPRKDPSEEFEFSIPEPKTPIKKQPLRTCNKRKIVVNSEISGSPKKLKTMTPEQMQEMFSGLQKTILSLNDKIDVFTNKLDKQDERQDTLNSNMTDLSNTFATFQESLKNSNKVMEDKMNNLENEFSKLQETVENSAGKAADEVKNTIVPMIQDEVVPQVKNEVKAEVLKSVEGTWKAQLAEKVKEHEKSAIVFGVPVNKQPFDDAIDFLENRMKLSHDAIDKILMVGAERLGRGDAKKPPPLLIHFSHPSERNLVLSFSKNLQKSKLSIEKHVPKIYQSQYKVFKSLATKLRLMPEMNYQTQIIFDSHLMLLRYKSKDTTTQKFNYTIHSQYYPPMNQAGQDLKSSLKIPHGTIATPVISSATLDKAVNSFFMTGMSKENTQETFMRKFMEFIKTDDKEKVIEAKLLRNNTAVIYCKTWEDCKKMVEGLKTPKFENENVFFSLFSEEKP